MPQFDRSMVSTSKLFSVDIDGDHYYGGSSAASIPFKWESHPGTPRRLFTRSSSSGFDFSSPVSAPLTPPPSYFYASISSTKTINPKKNNTHFGSFRSKNRGAPSSPAASSSSSSSSASSPLRNTRRSTWFGYGSKHYNANSSGCYSSIFKVLLRDVK